VGEEPRAGSPFSLESRRGMCGPDSPARGLGGGGALGCGTSRRLVEECFANQSLHFGVKGYGI
jgi:hypothetical protein